MQPVIIHRGSTYKNKGNRRERRKNSSGFIDIKVGKIPNKHRCHGCNRLLLSIAAKRRLEFSRLTLSQRRVARPYGATHCGKCVAEKITSAFLTDEERIIAGRK